MLGQSLGAKAEAEAEPGVQAETETATGTDFLDEDVTLVFDLPL